jgi:hypothetical protein
MPHRFALRPSMQNVRLLVLTISIGDYNEPDVILNYHHSWSLLGLPVEQTTLPFNHQFNGQTGQLSRSWNRIILGFTFAPADNVLLGFRT